MLVLLTEAPLNPKANREKMTQIMFETFNVVVTVDESSEEFIGTLKTLKMAIDDLVGLSGENVKPLPEHYAQALKTAYDRYSKYLDSFGPHEFYLKKKVESELGRRMIHLKMRCGGLASILNGERYKSF